MVMNRLMNGLFTTNYAAEAKRTFVVSLAIFISFIILATSTAQNNKAVN